MRHNSKQSLLAFCFFECFLLLVVEDSLALSLQLKQQHDKPAAKEPMVKGSTPSNAVGALIDPKSPVISQKPESKLVTEGQPLRLKCEAHGAPTPVISWFQNDRALLHQGEQLLNETEYEPTDENKQSIGFGITSSILMIPCVDASVSGIYTCSASSTEGITVSNSFVTMEAKESTNISEDTCDSQKGERSIVFSWISNRLEEEDMPVQLRCVYFEGGIRKGRPFWYFQTVDGKSTAWIPAHLTGGDHRILENGNLLIMKPDVSCQTGCNYACDYRSFTGLEIARFETFVYFAARAK